MSVETSQSPLRLLADIAARRDPGTLKKLQSRWRPPEAAAKHYMVFGINS
jgi:hypothetical protein